MADIPQVLATYDALVGLALGAGLTYGFSALNRRHQEAREDRTRWYEARLQAYIELHQATYDVLFNAFNPLGTMTIPTHEVVNRLSQRLVNAVGAIHFVGSPEVIEAAEKVLEVASEEMDPKKEMSGDFIDMLEKFHVAARKDLGHPSP